MLIGLGIYIALIILCELKIRYIRRNGVEQEITPYTLTNEDKMSIITKVKHKGCDINYEYDIVDYDMHKIVAEKRKEQGQEFFKYYKPEKLKFKVL